MRFILALASLATTAFATSSFTCPPTKGYCPWAQSCQCPPGLSLDITTNSCAGTLQVGAWANIDVSVYADVSASADVTLGTFCAISPYKIVAWDPNHRYCQVGLDTITIAADVSITAEIDALGLAVNLDAEIDVDADISVELKNVCGALAGLYVDTAAHAVALFNTDVYGFAVVAADIEADVSVSLYAWLTAQVCVLGLLGNCNVDCVSNCVKGCKNYIDVDVDVDVEVDVDVAAAIGVINGVAILPGVICLVNSARVVVTITVDSLLCVVGRLLESLLSTFNCGCQ